MIPVPLFDPIAWNILESLGAASGEYVRYARETVKLGSQPGHQIVPLDQQMVFAMLQWMSDNDVTFNSEGMAEFLCRFAPLVNTVGNA